MEMHKLKFKVVNLHTNPPDNVKYGREKEFVIDCDCHVAWLVEGGRYSANSVAQVDPPEQEEQLSYREAQHRTSVSCNSRMFEAQFTRTAT